ncbi:hypothetical protein QAD02_010829 [Eretmocerus hayati]|uniref:Uncharacterized protein n=1 Tax=Eretmocerus hayati TaxID=131215 RepID=A0ACC2NW01_9HYME|nr:hypothetical protein QAD02_010829 [Eretmocerus hayati]
MYTLCLCVYPPLNKLIHNLLKFFTGTGPTYCRSLYFDKVKDVCTRYVQGYIFKTSYTSTRVTLDIGYEYDQTRTGYTRCSGTRSKPLCFVLNYINATFTAKSVKGYAFVNKYGQPDGSLIDIQTEAIHFLFAPYYIRDYWRIQTYPFHAGEMKIVTYKKPMATSDIMISYLNLQTLVTILSLYFILLIILKYSLNTSWYSLVMEYLRVLVGATTVAKLKEWSRRLALIFLISAIAIVTSCFRGYLSALITFPQSRPVVDSQADLIESRLVPKGRFSCKDTIFNEYLNNFYSVMENHHECLRLMLNRTPIACIMDEMLIPYTFDDDPRIHVSQANFLGRGWTFTFTDDSPLLNKMIQVLSWMREASFSELFWNKRKPRADFNYSEDTNFGGSFIYENQMMIICSLCTAWSVSAVVFLIEIAYFHMKKLKPSNNTRALQVIRKRKIRVQKRSVHFSRC